MPGEELTTKIVKVCNELRSLFQDVFPQDYPAGQRGVEMVQFSHHLIDDGSFGNRSSRCCVDCLQCYDQDDSNGQAIYRYTLCLLASSIGVYLAECLSAIARCQLCSATMTYTAHKLLCMHVGDVPNIVIENELHLKGVGIYRLVGIVYFGNFHFVSRSITSDKMVYVHDGMNGPYSTFEVSWVRR